MAKVFMMTFRGVVLCKDEVEAAMVAEVIRSEGSKHLEPDDGDELFISQVTEFQKAAEPAELIDRLLRARNDLIITRIKSFWDTAKMLDECIWGLQKGLDPMMADTYDHARFMEVATRIYNGEYPL